MDSVDHTLIKKREQWVCRESRSRPGKIYYFNKKTGETRWSCPDLSNVELPTPTVSHKRKIKGKESIRKFKQKDPNASHVFQTSSTNSPDKSEAHSVQTQHPKTRNGSSTTSICAPVSNKNICSATSCSSVPVSVSCRAVSSNVKNTNAMPFDPKINKKGRKRTKFQEDNQKNRMTVIQATVDSSSSASNTDSTNRSKDAIGDRGQMQFAPVPFTRSVPYIRETANFTKSVNLAESRMKNLQKVLSVQRDKNENLPEPSPLKPALLPKAPSTCGPKPHCLPPNHPAQVLSSDETCEGNAPQHSSSKLQKRTSETFLPQKGLRKKNCPAASRLKRLQDNISANRQLVLPPSDELLHSALAETANITYCSQQFSKYKSDNCVSLESKKASEMGVFPLEEAKESSNDQELELMEVDNTEWNVLNDINELRKRDVSKEVYQPSLMELDWQDETIISNDKHLFVVLDTNVLISNLKMIQGLRDSEIQGKGRVILYLPWQVIQELDSMKDHGKISLRPSARQAINFLHDNLASKHPRVRGQKYNSKNRDAHCPDDNILQACLELRDQGCDVMLFSNDKNLCNKALLSGIQAVSKDELLKLLSEQREFSTPSINLNDLGSSAHSSLPGKNEVSCGSTVGSADLILCELKSNIKKFLSEVVSCGMAKEYGALWKKRTIIPPPWEVDDILKCLSHHWLPICGDGDRNRNIRQLVDRVLEFLKLKTKRYGVDLVDVQGAVESTLILYDSLLEKYSSILLTGRKQLESLFQKSKQCSIDPTSHKSSTSTATIILNSAPEIPCEERSRLVLACFERAFRAVTELCDMKSRASEDNTWREEVRRMLQVVHLMTECMTSLLSVPSKDLIEPTPAVSDVLHLIKGDTDVNEWDLINFCRSENTRNLMLNGLQQFLALGSILGSLSDI